VPGFLERLGVALPVAQAGMGGGISRHELAAAVSQAGGLGTLGFLDAKSLRRELEATRAATGKPVAVNLLLPFARAAEFEVAGDADIVVTFWGRPVRRTSNTWIHQCGSVDEALAARAAGADAVIAQGVEAGGHVRSETPGLELLARVRSALGDDYPVLAAGGVAEAGDVRERLAAGAEAVVCGTRFVLSDESGAHPDYKSRLLAAEETVLTELFGAGWPAPHRVVPNAATRRWLGGDDRGPGWLRAIHRASAPALSRVPVAAQIRLASIQSPRRPLFSPVPPTAGGPASLVDAGPLYAGETVARIHELRPAGELVAELAS
jgi:nitronate monooxygenase